MLPPVQHMYPKRKVLIEMPLSLDERLKLWLNKLKHPRDPWFAKARQSKTSPDQKSDFEPPM